MPTVFDTGALLRPPFLAAQFTPTKWDSAETKATFANELCRFIAADFKESLFTDKLYRRLSNTFGHIGHHDRRTFFAEFFRSLSGKVAFLEQTLHPWPGGDPVYTYGDVEAAVRTRLRACQLLDAYRALRDAAAEREERALLRRLHAKYDGTAPPAATPILNPGAPPARARPSQESTQGALF